MRGLLDSRGSMVSDLSPGAFGGPFALNGNVVLSYNQNITIYQMYHRYTYS